MSINELTEKFLSSIDIDNFSLNESNEEKLLKFIFSFCINNDLESYFYESENYSFDIELNSIIFRENYNNFQVSSYGDYNSEKIIRIDILYGPYKCSIKEKNYKENKNKKFDIESIIEENKKADEKIKQQYLFDIEMKEKVLEILKYKNDLTMDILKFLNIQELFDKFSNNNNYILYSKKFENIEVAISESYSEDIINIEDNSLKIIYNGYCLGISHFFRKKEN